MTLKYALFGGLLLVGANAMACYTVYDASSRVVYQGAQAPVDMSLPLHQALERRFSRGAQMVFEQTSTCGTIGIAQVPRPTTRDVPPNTIRLERASTKPSSSAPAPLFTDRQTAERSHLPHTQVAGDIVMVPPAVADQVMRPSVSVIPATALASAAPTGPDTSVLGAGPAPAYRGPSTTTLGAGPGSGYGGPGMSAMGAGPSPMGTGTPRRRVVITEMRDGTVTVNDY